MSDQLRETRRRANLTFIGAIIVLAVINGTYSALTVFAGDLCTRLNASVTDVMLMFTVCSVVSMVANLVSGALMARVPTRILAFIGTLCFIAFFLLMRFATSLAMLYVGAFYDSTGSYSNFMICAAILCALALVAVLWASSSKNVKKLQERAAAGKERN